MAGNRVHRTTEERRCVSRTRVTRFVSRLSPSSNFSRPIYENNYFAVALEKKKKESHRRQEFERNRASRRAGIVIFGIQKYAALNGINVP